MTGPCAAMEARDGRTICGLVRNPLGYLFKAVHPDADVPVLGTPPEDEHGYQLSVEFASALGLGQGWDAEDDDNSAAWAAPTSTRYAAQPKF